MIMRKDVWWASGEDCDTVYEEAITLKKLVELRQQLKYEIRNNLLNKRKLDSVLVSLQNTFVLDACEIINKVLGVEGEK